MQKNKFTLSMDFIQNLIVGAGGAVSSDILDKVLNSLQKETQKYFFTSTSEANLLRIFSSVYEKSLFISELSLYPHHVEIVTAIAANSNYLTDIVVRNPEYLYQVFDQSYLSQNLDELTLQDEIRTGLNRFKSFPTKLNFLRQAKKRFILKIGLVDILGLDDLKSVTTQLSALAKTINSELFELSYAEILLKYKLNLVSKDYCLCSLGKLGGNELNYSSDVDLILFFENNFTIKEIKKDYHEILSEAALLYIKSSTAITDRGYIYRVDFRLRPDGKYSPLCKTLNDYTKYYETRGEDWERQMLLKLNFICGDQKLYERFRNFLQPYIFPTSFSSSLKEQIKRMKSNIERQIRDREDVKLFSGGIRDIEFSVQALQLLNGGRSKELQTGNTLEAIERLTNEKLLNESEQKTLTEAYIFYRRIEHFLQLMNDTQTHLIPSEGELLNKLARYFGFNSAVQFKQKLEIHRKKVRFTYNEILSTDESSQDYFTKINFNDKSKADKNLEYLRNGIGLSGKKEFDARTINLFAVIEPALIDYLNNSVMPDKVLNNFVKVIHSTGFPSIWYNEFANLKFFKLFLEICSFSQKAIDLFSTDKILEEFFLSRRALIKNPEDELIGLSINQIIMILAVQFALKLISTDKVSSLLSSYVDLKIQQTLDNLKFDYKYFIGGLGSFGSSSMNFSSDIDLIVVTDDVNKYKNIQADFQKFIMQIQMELKPFEVDFRLRPEGKKSPLVWDIKNYEKYLNERARTWEFQSLLKLRFIAGDKKLFNELQNILIDRIKSLDAQTIRNEIKKMFGNVQKEFSVNEGSFNIKKQNGGLISIDFMLQSLALADAIHFRYCMNKSIPDIISYFVKKGYKDFSELKSNYQNLRTLEFTIQNIFNTNSPVIPTDKNQMKLIKSCLDLTDNIEQYIANIIKSNNKFLEKYLGK